MTDRDDHGDLPGHAGLMIESLDTLYGRFVYGRTSNHLHTEHAERCRILANHLSAMLTLCETKHCGFRSAGRGNQSYSTVGTDKRRRLVG